MTVKNGGAIIVRFSLGRVDTRNLTQRRKDAIIAMIPDFYPVIPAKAGIQRVGNGVCAPPFP